MPARPIRPTRGDILDALDAELAAIAQTPGIRAAWQGATGAKDAWRTATGPADLDIWCDDAGFAVLDATLSRFHAARIQQADRPGRLRHVSYAIETLQGLAVVDLTRGDLMVGPVLLVPAAHVRTVGVAARDGGPQLAGVAGAADRFVRPLLRGRIVDGERLDQARAEWSRAERGARAAFLVQPAHPARPRRSLARHRARARRRRRPLHAGTRRPPSTGHEVPAPEQPRRRPGPAGTPSCPPARARACSGCARPGCLVVLVGTDGSGKSTVAGEIDDRLTSAGLRTSTAYLGMARGNLPGVGLARRLLGVAPAGDSAPAKATPADAHGQRHRSSTPPSAASRPGTTQRSTCCAGGATSARACATAASSSPTATSTTCVSRPGRARRHPASRSSSCPAPTSSCCRMRPTASSTPASPSAPPPSRRPSRTASASSSDRLPRARSRSPWTRPGCPFDLDPVAPVVSAVVASAAPPALTRGALGRLRSCR